MNIIWMTFMPLVKNPRFFLEMTIFEPGSHCLSFCLPYVPWNGPWELSLFADSFDPQIWGPGDLLSLEESPGWALGVSTGFLCAAIVSSVNMSEFFLGPRLPLVWSLIHSSMFSCLIGSSIWCCLTLFIIIYPSLFLFALIKFLFCLLFSLLLLLIP